MRKAVIVGTALSLIASPALAQETLVIEDFIGTVTISTDAGKSLRIKDRDNAGDLKINDRDGSLVIDGGIEKVDGSKCQGHYGRFNFTFFSDKERKGNIGGYKDLDEYPKLTITAPDDVNLIIRNSAIFGTAGNIGSGDLDLRHCGNLEIGDINGPLDLNVRGSADVKTGNAKSVDARISGSGDLEMLDIEDGTFSVSGSGDIEIGNATSLDVRVSGSGDISFEDVSGNAKFRSSGSGDVEGGEVFGGLDYDASGSGDLDIENVVGDLSVEISGSGDAAIDDGDVDHLIVHTSGSSSVDFDGTAQTADLDASGSSDIFVDTVEGKASVHASSSSDIDIDHQ